MNRFCALVLILFLAHIASAKEEEMLACVTVYWRTGSNGDRAHATGARLRTGHCAVDPTKIPYGSKVIFPDAECVAVDTGPAVVSRKSARYCGRTAAQKKAIVIDRFFETKRQALAWAQAHPRFMTVRVIPPGSPSEPKGPW